LDIKLTDRETNQAENIQDTPRDFKIFPGPISNNTSTVEALTEFIQCSPILFLVRTFDSLNNKQVSGNALIQAFINSEWINSDLEVIDNEDGTYLISIYLADGGLYSLSVTVQDNPLLGSPYIINLTSIGTNICYQPYLVLLAIFVVIVLIYISALLCIIIRYRRNPVISKQSPLFTCLILVGNLMMCISVALNLSDPNVLTCNLSQWLNGVGFCLMFGSLFAHNFRLWRIFSSAEKLKIKAIPDVYVLVIVSIFLLLLIILYSIWMGVDPITPTQFELGSIGSIPTDQLSLASQCYPTRIFFGIWTGYQVVLLLLGTFISIAVRKVKVREYNQSRDISLAIYSYFFIVITQTINAFMTSDFWTNLLLGNLLLLFKIVFVLSCLFIPRLFLLFETLK